MDETPLIISHVNSKYPACTRMKIIDLINTGTCIRPDMAGSTHPQTGSITLAPTPIAIASANMLAIEYLAMHPIAESITPTTTTGIGLTALNTQAVTGHMAVPTLPSRQPNVPGFHFMGLMHLGASDFFPTNLDCMFNPGMLPGPYSGGSGVVPSGTFDIFNPMASSTLPLLPPVHGDMGLPPLPPLP